MSTLEKIKQIISDDLVRSDFTDSTTLEQLAIDSLDLIDLMHAIEAAFQIEIPDDEFPQVSFTIADLAALVERKCAANRGRQDDNPVVQNI